METFCCNAVLTALSSISHNGGQSFGVTTKLRREKFAQPDGSVEDVPVLSGNGIRGRLRDLGMRHMLNLLGYGAGGKGLTMPAFHFLFSGGALTSVGGKALQVAEARRLRSLIPLVGIFGGAMGNAILPGILKCGKSIPICLETKHLLPVALQDSARQSIWDYLQEEMYTRKDDSKNDRLRPLLTQNARMMIEADEQASSVKAGSLEPVVETGQAAQMRYYTETFAAGTRFYWRIVLDDPTDLEMDAFATCLVEFARHPYLGGKSNIGIGEVALDLSDWLRIDARHLDGAAVTSPLAALYSEHLHTRSAEICELLSAI